MLGAKDERLRMALNVVEGLHHREGEKMSRRSNHKQCTNPFCDFQGEFSVSSSQDFISHGILERQCPKCGIILEIPPDLYAKFGVENQIKTSDQKYVVCDTCDNGSIYTVIHHQIYNQVERRNCFFCGEVLRIPVSPGI